MDRIAVRHSAAAADQRVAADGVVCDVDERPASKNGDEGPAHVRHVRYSSEVTDKNVLDAVRPWWLLPPGQIHPAWWVAMCAAIVGSDYIGGIEFESAHLIARGRKHRGISGVKALWMTEPALARAVGDIEDDVIWSSVVARDAANA